MVDFLVSKLHDVRFMTMLLAAIAASATVYTLVMPLLAGEGLSKRMKAVASERERIRQRERERLHKNEKVSLRQTPKQVVSKVVEDFNLTKWLAQEAARDKLIMAGYRGHAPYVTFLFARAGRTWGLDAVLARRGRRGSRAPFVTPPAASQTWLAPPASSSAPPTPGR